jgi:hypothetical protein
MALEGRTLLSTFTVTSTAHHADVGTLRPAGGTLAHDQVVHRGNSARLGGGVRDDGTTTRRDVVIRNDIVRVGSGPSSTRNLTTARRGRSRPRSTGPILNQTFNGTGFPSGWQTFLPGVVAQSPKTFLTITDSTGNSAGIISNPTKTVPFNPVGVVTTIKSQISSISGKPLGNAVFGLLGPNGAALAGELAAGIDAAGHVFIVEFDPAQKITQQTIVQVGVVTGYTGGPVAMTVIIDSKGVQITAGTTKFREFSFSKDLNNFSITTAFPNGAIPALVAASQPPQKGGAASFESISVSTSLGHRIRKHRP